MVLTYDQRIALLEKARKAKADKRAGLNKKPEPEPDPEPEPAVLAPKKTRAKSVKAKRPPEGRTLELPPEPAPMSDSEPEVEERIVYRPKPERKKKIIRTIIKDHTSDEDEEEIVHETVEQPPKPKKKIQPKLCPSKSSYFCY
jgi:hypothetical protein